MQMYDGIHGQVLRRLPNYYVMYIYIYVKLYHINVSLYVFSVYWCVLGRVRIYIYTTNPIYPYLTTHNTIYPHRITSYTPIVQPLTPYTSIV